MLCVLVMLNVVGCSLGGLKETVQDINNLYIMNVWYLYNIL
jgi:hypothetical protein